MATKTNYQYGTSYSGRSGSVSRRVSTGSYGHNTRNHYAHGRNVQDRQSYVYGNVARQLEEVPERRERPERQRRTKRYPKQRPVAMPSISGASFVFLMAAALITLAFCFNYLRIQSGITQMKNETVALQNQIAETKVSNEEAYQKISDSVDLSEVYKIATGELGMVQAVDNQVYKYKNKKSDMVKQYGDIPEASK
ncbi:MAG: hypothetical protein J5979_00820 [Lachnospiraceae bacterium]|nr:hypothetical protein [Lachnospiraceae bacterium]